MTSCETAAEKECMAFRKCRLTKHKGAYWNSPTNGHQVNENGLRVSDSGMNGVQHSGDHLHCIHCTIEFDVVHPLSHTYNEVVVSATDTYCTFFVRCKEQETASVTTGLYHDDVSPEGFADDVEATMGYALWSLVVSHAVVSPQKSHSGHKPSVPVVEKLRL